MQEEVKIFKVVDPVEKALIVAEVLEDLPAWFGLAESTEAYIDQSRDLDLWLAKKGQEIVGYISLSETSPETGEIHSTGLKESYHRKGLGTKLLLTLEDYAKKIYKFLQVKTVDEGHYPEYDQTLAFYRAMGFSRLEIFPDLWDSNNPCLILVKSL